MKTSTKDAILNTLTVMRTNPNIVNVSKSEQSANPNDEYDREYTSIYMQIANDLGTSSSINAQKNGIGGDATYSTSITYNEDRKRSTKELYGSEAKELYGKINKAADKWCANFENKISDKIARGATITKKDKIANNFNKSIKELIESTEICYPILIKWLKSKTGKKNLEYLKEIGKLITNAIL